MRALRQATGTVSQPRAVGAPATQEPLSYAILRIAQKGGIRESSGCMFPQLHVPRTREKSDFFGNFTPKNPKKLVDSPI